MNERERAEFEHHKKAAEEQLNRMYYGTGKKPSSRDGLAVPDFVNAKNSPSVNRKDNEKSNPKPKPDKLDEPTQIKEENGSRKSLNLLNLLNFKGLKMDNDRLIVLAVCLLLAGEDADELLLLALMYIML